MANLGKFVHTKTGKIIMSIILGLGLASLFRKVCKNYDCIQLYAVPFNKIFVEALIVPLTSRV